MGAFRFPCQEPLNSNKQGNPLFNPRLLGGGSRGCTVMAFYNSSQVQGDVELHSCQENCRLYAGCSNPVPTLCRFPPTVSSVFTTTTTSTTSTVDFGELTEEARHLGGISLFLFLLLVDSKGIHRVLWSQGHIASRILRSDPKT